jgi:hypothetical protein
VSDFYNGSCQGVIRIPAGEKSQGWVEFSAMCKGVWDTNNSLGSQVAFGGDRRRATAGGIGTSLGMEKSKPQFSHNDINFKNNVEAAVNIALGDMNVNKKKKSSQLYGSQPSC